MLLLWVELLTFSEPVERVYTYSQSAWQLLQSAQHNSNTHVSSCCSLESWVMSYGHAQREWAIPLHQYPWNTNRACVSLILITTKKHLAVFSIFQDQIALGRMFPGEEPITGIGVCAEGDKKVSQIPQTVAPWTCGLTATLSWRMISMDESLHTKSSHLLMDPFFPTVPLAGNVGQMRFSRVFNIHNNVPITSGTS